MYAKLTLYNLPLLYINNELQQTMKYGLIKILIYHYVQAKNKIMASRTGFTQDLQLAVDSIINALRNNQTLLLGY